MVQVVVIRAGAAADAAQIAAVQREGWFAAYDGVTLVDPLHLHENRQPPPVHIEDFVADRKAYAAFSGVRLPPLVRDLEIQYTGLSYIKPEQIKFRYRLEGLRNEWVEDGPRRQPK